MQKATNKPAWVMVVRENLSNYEKEVLSEDAKVATSESVSRLLGPRLGREEVEVMVVVVVDGHNHVKHLAEISRGGLHGTSVAARDILRIVLVAGGSGFILVHNHPSGDPSPSQEDITMTKKVSQVAELVGVSLLDHVILAGEKRHYSMLDHGIIA